MKENILRIRDKIPGYRWTQQDNDNRHKNRSLKLVSNPGTSQYIALV
jgi:hypothetical protein